MNQDQKLAVSLIGVAVGTAFIVFANMKLAKATDLLNKKTDMLLKLNNFTDPSIIK